MLPLLAFALETRPAFPISCTEQTSRQSGPRRGQYIALDVAKGLHYLHSNSVVHLDIKVRPGHPADTCISWHKQTVFAGTSGSPSLASCVCDEPHAQECSEQPKNIYIFNICNGP